MLEKSGVNYRYIIFIRPDCRYLDKLKGEFLKKADEKTIVMPDFHLYNLLGGLKTNDRFAVTTMETYKIYGFIFDKLLEISKKMELHSETVLGKILTDNGISIEKIPFLFHRIRYNGKTDPIDMDMKR